MGYSPATLSVPVFSRSISRRLSRNQRSAYAVLVRLLSAVLLALFVWQSSVLAESTDIVPTADPELTATVATALKTLDATDLDDDWYFTMGVVEEDERLVIHSDPTRDKYEKRTLLSVNDVAPDEERQEEFYDAEVERIDALDPDASGYAYMVDFQTLQLLETANDVARFSFTPRVKALEDSRDKISGLLLLNLASGQIEQIEIRNTEPLSPAFSVTVDTYLLTLHFLPEQGENLLSQLESKAAGKAGFVKSFDTAVTVSFGDYKRANH